MKKLGILFATVIMAMLFVVSASAATEGYYTYKVENGEAIITNVDGSISGDVVIPSTLGGYSVTSIGYSAFSVCEGLTSITIPDSVTSIGESAFTYCTGLTSFTIPDSVTSIGNYAFSSCKSLTSITISDSVTNIGLGAFVNCEGLTSISVDENNKKYSNDSNGMLFNKNKTELVTYPAGKTETTYIIPDSVTSIGNYAFSYCKSLTSITIPGKVTSIGYSAFYECTGLTSITIPDSVTSIYGYAFYYCTGLTSISIPGSVTIIGDRAFEYCTGLTSISVDENNKKYSNDRNGVLFNKDKTKLVTYPEGKTETTYIIPDSVINICDDAFSYCKSLTNITIPNSITSIGNRIFWYCTSLTSITIPDSVTSIGNNAFFQCTGLTNIIIGDNVTSIDYCAFEYCTSLISVTIPDSVTSIGNFAFDRCTALNDIYYGGTEEQWEAVYIGDYNDDLLNATIHYHYNNHLYAETVTTPTCTTQGYTTYTCECGESYVSDYVDATGHSFTNYISDGKATCTTDGLLIAKCDNCDATDTKPEKGTHKFSDSFAIDLDPTCTTVGQKSRHCLNCTEKTDITPIGKLAHTYNTITIDPTCTDRGHKIYTCLCGDSYTETLPALGHNFSGSVCTTCGYDKADDCTCNCHKTGLSALIWKILNFFYRLLRLNPTCNCGIAHY